jgi:hypothetical protein
LTEILTPKPNWGRDAAFGALLFVVIVVVTIVTTKAAQFVYAMF